VETSRELGLPRQVLTVDYDENNGLLVAHDRRFERKPITTCRDALNGYQKGKCFYCAVNISVVSDVDQLAEVDHFIPHRLKFHLLGGMSDGVWTLVLSGQRCNRGTDGKFAQIPMLRYLKRLHRRNECFISGYHPLRETLMEQTGSTESERIEFLNSVYNASLGLLIGEWKTRNEYETAL
jgi:hypothetical protein